MTEHCSSGCERPEEIYYPLPARVFWKAWFFVRYPYDVHLMKKAGFRRTGWMRWEIRL